MVMGAPLNTANKLANNAMLKYNMAGGHSCRKFFNANAMTNGGGCFLVERGGQPERTTTNENLGGWVEQTTEKKKVFVGKGGLLLLLFFLRGQREGRREEGKKGWMGKTTGRSGSLGGEGRRYTRVFAQLSSTRDGVKRIGTRGRCVASVGARRCLATGSRAA